MKIQDSGNKNHDDVEKSEPCDADTMDIDTQVNAVVHTEIATSIEADAAETHSETEAIMASTRQVNAHPENATEVHHTSLTCI